MSLVCPAWFGSLECGAVSPLWFFVRTQTKKPKRRFRAALQRTLSRTSYFLERRLSSPPLQLPPLPRHLSGQSLVESDPWLPAEVPEQLRRVRPGVALIARPLRLRSHDGLPAND